MKVSFQSALLILLADTLSAFQHVHVSSLNRFRVGFSSTHNRNSIFAARRCIGPAMIATRSSVQSNEYSLGVVGDFSLILAQSAILASAASIAVHELPNFSHSTKATESFQAQRGFNKDALPVLQLQHSYEIRCITDGFEFNQDSSVKVTHGQSVSYRQCEALRESSSGML
uniref:Uncharacterized protein n=1 Tax=Cryptomonas curvata TaxID=233186 RepID=A0A6T7X790_9CRYP|mmetsp:Transcript_27118/g.56354  ORF Transcript_27118/g.56354 Transcript_27118/m.56354 type:complete len:171 (+) Transcript_27118:61-573(+)